MQPYRIHCLTCNAPLKIDDPSAVGQIFNCPKCFSMVMVTPPPDAVAAGEAIAAPAVQPARAAAPRQGKAAAPHPKPPVAPPPVLAASLAAAAPQFMPWQKWLVLGGSGTAGVALMLGIWFVALRGNHSAETVASRSGSPGVGPDTAQAEEPIPAARKSSALDSETKVAPSAHAIAKVEPPIETKQASAPAAQPAASALSPEPAPPAAASVPPSPPAPAALPKSEDTPPLMSRTIEPPIAEAPPRPVRPLPPADAALEARLALPLAGVKMPATPLRTLLDTIGLLGAVKIQCDPAALARTGITLDDTATVQTEAASLADVLKQVLATRGLTFVASGDRVIVTTAETPDQPQITVHHAVEDLAPNRAGLERLAHLVRAVVLPETWQSAGGAGKLTFEPGKLVVRQGAEAQWQIRQLCDKLRLARGLPVRGQDDPAWLVPQTRRELLAASLGKKVSISAAQGMPLADILRQVAARSGVGLDLDELSLARYGIDPQLNVKIHIDDLPLEKTLHQLLSPLGLAWQPAGPATLIISTLEDLRGRSMVEVYPLAELAADRQAAEALAVRLTWQIASGSWQAEGGQGVIQVDLESRALVVCQPYPIQFQLAAALAK